MNVIYVLATSIGLLSLLGVAGWVLQWLEHRAYSHERELVNKQYEPQEPVPFWFGDPPDGDTFP